MTGGKHTPGPWEWVCEDGPFPTFFLSPGILQVESGMTAGTPAGDASAKANARLIAAAPDLYQLVKLVNDSFGGGRVMTFSDLDMAEFAAAIAKAEGAAA